MLAAKIPPDINHRTDDHADDFVGISISVRVPIFGASAWIKMLITIISSFQIGLKNGGPAGLIYGFLFSWAGTTLQALVMGEMGSMWVLSEMRLHAWSDVANRIPLAGGYYNWYGNVGTQMRISLIV